MRTDIEDVYVFASRDGNTVIGNSGPNTLFLSGGGTIVGGAGRDDLSGTARMLGGAGGDALEGEGVLLGGAGNDHITAEGRVASTADPALIASTRLGILTTPPTTPRGSWVERAMTPSTRSICGATPP